MIAVIIWGYDSTIDKPVVPKYTILNRELFIYIYVGGVFYI